jgi:DNA polymerase elongation subunit (family B)
MKTCDIDAATRFLNDNVGAIVRGDCPISKFVITKSLRGSYAKPKQVAHKVLADRIAERDPGNAPRSGDRIAYVHVHVPNGANLLTGEKIELPGVVLEKHLRIDYTYYITNQVMKPVQQLFALVLEKLPRFRNVSREYERTVDEIWVDGFDTKSIHDKVAKLRMKMVKRIMFDDHLVRIKNAHSGMSEITQFFGPSKK